jgi:molecular chaperone HtpG
MSQTSATRKDASTGWRQSASPIIIGKDMLELLSSSMYVDSMAIYREYVQNAVDSIEEARQSKLLPDGDSGTVNISIAADTRTIRIRDNGTGIGRDMFEERLSAFGASPKRGTRARGFRGVGRIAGLGYCQELIFRSRTSGESNVHEMLWDGRNIKAMLRATDDASSLEGLVKSVVNVRDVDAKGWPDHFFEVELRGIVRLKDDSLLNNVAVYDYLSEVAPVPFSPDFEFGEKIVSALSAHISLGNFDIRIDSFNEPVYRPHRNELEARGGATDRITDVEICEIPSVDGQAGAIAWLLHHGYQGAILNPHIRGLRLRTGNIQIGGHDLLEELFAERRFNSWAIGEIHTIDKRIIPNSRRDHYEQNGHFNNLTNYISPIARQISARCRKSSVLRNLRQEFHRHETLVKDKLQAIRQGGLDAISRKKTLDEIDGLVIKMQRILFRNLLPDDVQKALKGTVDKVEKETGKIRKHVGTAEPLARLSPTKRNAYQKIIGLIYECSSNPASAHSLVERILGKLN